MSNQEKPNYSINIDYLLECCNITFTQSKYVPGTTIPHCNIGLSTLKKARLGYGMSTATAQKLSTAFSRLLIHPETRRIFAEDLDLPEDKFKQLFPSSSFVQNHKNLSYINVGLFTNKLFRGYYLVPNSPNSAYMAYFKLFEKNNQYHAYMIRGIQDFDLVPELPFLFKTPEKLYEFIENKYGNKKTESMHLYEAWNDDSAGNRREDITITANRIMINFHSVETEPCYSTMIWNITTSVTMNIETYIGGSALIFDTNDGSRGKNICAFKMGLEAIEDIPMSQQEIIKKGPLIHDSSRVIRELSLETVDGRLVFPDGDDNRWYRFIQNDNYRGKMNLSTDINVESLIKSLVNLKTDYEQQLDELKSTIWDIKRRINPQ